MAKRKKAGTRAAGKGHAPLSRAHVLKLLEIEPPLVEVLKKLDLKLTTTGQLVKQAGTPLGVLCRATMATPLGVQCRKAAKSVLVPVTKRKPAARKAKARKPAKR